MNHKRFLSQMTNLLLTLLLVAACGPLTPVPISTLTPTPTTIPPTSAPSLADKSTITLVVKDAAKVMPDVAQDVVTLSQEKSQDGKTRYLVEKHNIVENIDSIAYLGLNDDIIWPGNLVRGDRATEFIYEPICVKRAPITLSISLESSTTTGPSITRQVEDPKLSTVRQGISDLLKNAVTDKTKVPAKVDFSYQRIYDESQIKLFLGADVKYGAGKLKANFNWDDTQKTTKIMARYRQIYYSIDIDQPLSPADFIDPTITEAELRAAIPSGSKPMYIAGVSYGMMAMIFIETASEEKDIAAALEAAYSGGADAEIKGDLSAKDILEMSSIKIMVYGGSTANLKNLATGYAAFEKVINASSDFGTNTPGVPILYKFRHLTDNTLALTSLTSQYSIKRPVQLIQKVKVTLISIACTAVSDDDWGPIDIDQIQIGLNAYDMKLNKQPELITIDNEPKAQINGNDFTELYFRESLDNPFWRTDPGGIYPVNLALYIEFNTDPENYDYELSKVDFRGYAHDDDAGWDSGEGYVGNMTIALRDIIGEHIFTIRGTEFSLDVKIKIELVD